MQTFWSKGVDIMSSILSTDITMSNARFLAATMLTGGIALCALYAQAEPANFRPEHAWSAFLIGSTTCGAAVLIGFGAVTLFS